MRKVLTTVAFALVALLLVPATSPAFRFGAKLNRTPDNGAPAHSCATDSGGGDLPSPCTRLLVSSETGAASGHIKSPSSGVITKIRVRAATPGKARFVVARVKNLDVNAAGGDAKAVSKSKSKQIAGNGFKAKNFIEVFRVHLQVRKGDYLGLNSSKTGAERCSSGSTRQLLFSPPLALGGGYRHNDSDASCTLMIQAIGHTT